MSEKKSKTAAEIAALLNKYAKTLDTHVEDHPRLRGLVGQMTRKAVAMTKPAKEAGPVQLSYADGQIFIEKTPFLHPSAFGAWRFKLSEAKGVESGTRVNKEGETVPTYESAYNKELGKSVLPEACKEQVLALIGSFFPGSSVQDVTEEVTAG